MFLCCVVACYCCCVVWVQASSEALSARQEAARARVSANSAQAGMMKQLNDQVGVARGEHDVPLFDLLLCCV